MIIQNVMIIFTKHFLERIEQRNLDLKIIKDVLNNQSIEPITDATGNFIKQKRLNGYLLRVIYRLVNHNMIVISSYKTSKIDKYSK